MKRSDIFGFTFLVSAAFFAAWAFWWEPARTVVVREELPVGPWRVELEGLRVAVLADLHVGAPHMKIDRLDEIVDLVNDERVDLVLLLGDYLIGGVVGGTLIQPEPIGKSLARLESTHGTYAVLGNHDWWIDGERVRAAFHHAGVTVLEDSWIAIDHHGAELYISGLADLWTRAPRIENALASIPPGSPLLLLSHEPDPFTEIPPHVSLMLAGHTHGGQVVFPLAGALMVPSKYGDRYARGFFVERGTRLFVSSGIGTSILPVRFGVPPEIVILELVAAK